MKAILAVGFGVGLLLAGCGQKAEKPAAADTNAPTGGSLLTAPGDYLKSAADAKHSVVKTIDTTSLDKAIQLFNVDQGRNPKDLNELVTKNYIGKLPDPPVGMKINYDATAGKVTVVPQ